MENLPLNGSWKGMNPIFGIKETKRTAPVLFLFDKELEEMKRNVFTSILELLCAERSRESNCKLTV